MCRFKSSAPYTVLAGVLWLCACVSASTKVYDTELKRATIERWNACLERNANASELPAIQLNKLMRRACEGYKRDVLALYPRNQASEVDQILANSAFRAIKSKNESNNAENQPGKQTQTILR